jgi:hypothetical protein
MTLPCSAESTRQPVAWERVFDVVVRATDFQETVVRLGEEASTRLPVDQMMLDSASFLGSSLLPVAMAFQSIAPNHTYPLKQMGGEIGLGCCCGELRL